MPTVRPSADKVPYRLNPFCFLSDRKVWCIAAGALALAGLAAGLQPLLVGANWYAHSGDSAVLGWLFGPMLLAFSALLTRAVPPLLHDMLRRGRVVARYDPESGGWESTGEQLNPDDAVEGERIQTLIEHLGGATRKTLEQVALQADLPKESVLVPAVEVVVTPHAGAPYVYRGHWRGWRLVVPMQGLPARSGRLGREGAELLLAHELAHALGSEGGGWAADANVAAWTSAGRTTVGTMCLPLLPVVLAGAALGQLRAPPLVGLYLLLLAGPPAVAVVGDAARAALASGGGGSRATAGGLVVGTVGLLLGYGALLAVLGAPVEALGSRWTAAAPVSGYVGLALGWVLAHLGERLGRRQMEYVADEIAASAVCVAAEKSEGGLTPERFVVARERAAAALSELQASGRSWAPDYSLGGFEGTPGLEGRAVTAGPAWSSWLAAPLRTHPTLEDRRQALRSPARQAGQPLMLALTTILVGTIVLPAVGGAGTEGDADTTLGAAAADTAVLLLLWLLVLVARRPPPAAAAGRGATTSGLWGEVRAVLRAAAVPAALSAAVLWALDLQGDLPFAPLPPVGGAVLALTYFGCLTGIYLLIRFTRLLQWHHYGGLGLGESALHHLVTAVRSGLLAGLLVGVCAAAWQLGLVWLAPAGDSAWLEAVVGARQSYVRDALAFGFVTLIAGISHAIVVVGAPSRPRRSYCPQGHPVEATRRDPYSVPQEGDQAWSHCAECGQSPADGVMLAPLDLRGSADWRRTPLVVGVAGALVALQLLSLGFVVLPDLIELGVVGRCRELSLLAGGTSPLFADCPMAAGGDRGLAAPSPTEAGRPEAWTATFPPGATAALGVPLYARALGAAVEDSSQFAAPFVARLGCEARVAEWRNRVAYFEACAATPQDADVDECLAGMEDPTDMALQCRCMWVQAGPEAAGPVGPTNQEPVVRSTDEAARRTRAMRTRSTAALYGWAHGYYHAEVVPSCTAGEAPPAYLSALEPLHRWSDRSTAWRVFTAVAEDLPPDAHLSGVGPPAEIERVCERVLDGDGLRQVEGSLLAARARCAGEGGADCSTAQAEARDGVRRVHGCLTAENLLRIESEAEVAVALYEANLGALFPSSDLVAEHRKNETLAVLELRPLTTAPLATMDLLRDIAGYLGGETLRWPDEQARTKDEELVRDLVAVRNLLDELHQRHHATFAGAPSDVTWVPHRERELLCEVWTPATAPERWARRVACANDRPAGEEGETAVDVCTAFFGPRGAVDRDELSAHCASTFFSADGTLAQGEWEACTWFFGMPEGCEPGAVGEAAGGLAKRLYGEPDFLATVAGNASGLHPPAGVASDVARHAQEYFAGLRGRVACGPTSDADSDAQKVFRYAICSRLQFIATQEMRRGEGDASVPPVPLEVLRGLTDPGDEPNFTAVLGPGEFQDGWHKGYDSDLPSLLPLLGDAVAHLGDTARRAHLVRLRALSLRAAAAAVEVGAHQPYVGVPALQDCAVGRTRLAAMERCRTALANVVNALRLDVSRPDDSGAVAPRNLRAELGAKLDELRTAPEGPLLGQAGPTGRLQQKGASGDQHSDAHAGDQVDAREASGGGDSTWSRESASDRRFRLVAEWEEVPARLDAEGMRVPEFLNPRFRELRSAWSLPIAASPNAEEGE